LTLETYSTRNPAAFRTTKLAVLSPNQIPTRGSRSIALTLKAPLFTIQVDESQKIMNQQN
jgi:hypothetical protein